MPTATVNGANLNYSVRGAGSPALLIHGFQSSLFTWKPVVDFFAGHFQTFTIDLRGHGDSDRPPGPYSIQQFSDDVAAFLNFLGLEKITLAGHSMGGRTALMFTLQHPERVRQLILIGASGAAPKGEYETRFRTLQKVAEEEGIEAVMAHPLVTSHIPKSYLEGPGGEEYRRHYLKNTPQSYRDAGAALFTMPDLTGRLGEIGVPAWFCVGENEAPGIVAFSEQCERDIPNCTRSVIPGCGHFPMQDNTSGFLSELENFLAKTPVA
ncbi:MAG: alpha/beta hydrolase [bacterium]|nr:alpha/beta hydrolase [bacterium]